MIAYVAILLAGAFWTIDPEVVDQQIATGAQLLLMVLLIWHECTTERHVRSLQLAYVLGALVSVVATVIVFVSGAGTTDNRYMAPGFNPNELGVTLAIGIPIAWSLGATAAPPARWLYRLYIPAALLAVLLTASRGALIAAIVATTVIPLSYRSGKLQQKVGFALLLALSLYQVGQIVPAATWQRLLTIPQQFDSGDLNYRTVIWTAGLEIARDHPWLGIGPGAFPRAARRLLGGEFVAHNTFISVLVQQGIVGLGLFLGILVTLVGSIRATPKPIRSSHAFLLMTWTVGAMSISWEQKKVTWLVFALLLIGSTSVRRKRGMSTSPEFMTVDYEPDAAKRSIRAS
jgi:O-antigen ligase